MNFLFFLFVAVPVARAAAAKMGRPEPPKVEWLRNSQIKPGTKINILKGTHKKLFLPDGVEAVDASVVVLLVC